MIDIINFKNGKIFADGKLLATNAYLDTIEIEPEPLDINDMLNHPRFCNIEPEYNATFKIENADLNKKIDKLLTPDNPAFSFRTNVKEQIRKHHKTRINKKWAKRYGYRQAEYLFDVDNADIKPDDLSNEIYSINFTGQFREKRIINEQ